MWRLQIILVLVLALVAVKLLVRKIGCNCHACGRRMKFWDELAADEQQDILSYFAQVEKRQPKTSAIFLCTHCKHVYDDFSGERLSLDGDNASFCKICAGYHVNYFGQFGAAVGVDEFRDANPGLIDKTECLNCHRRPLSLGDCVVCDTNFKVMGCKKCKTLYAWVPMMSKKFLYTVPLSDAVVLENCPIGHAL